MIALTKRLCSLLPVLLLACSEAPLEPADGGRDAAPGADASLPDTAAPDAAEVEDATLPVQQNCTPCHAAQAQRLAKGAHAKVQNQCLECHKDALAHQQNPAVRASIEFSLSSCGSCHGAYASDFLKDDQSKPGKYGGSIKTSKYLDFPKYQHLMGGHGFTIEYNEERAHAWALKDHVDIKRKQNTVCLQCKSTPVTYYWNEQRRGMKLFTKDMTWSDAVFDIGVIAPTTADHGTTCNHCHDPHSGDFRLIRKAMLASVMERGTDPYDAARNFVPKTELELSAKLNERGQDGKRTAESLRLAGILTCAQCHVEYTCGPGVDKTVLRDDFPWRKLRDIEDYYRVKYNTVQDWTHTGTGLKGIKIQHPETEFFWESPHYKRGATCASCHLAKSGATHSHWFTSPLKQPNATCGNCHNDVADRVAAVAVVQDDVMNKAKVVENTLDAVLTFIEANPGYDAQKLAAAKQAFMRGLLWWEFTVVSENSAGFHNPTEANLNLDTALTEANNAKTLLGL